MEPWFFLFYFQEFSLLHKKIWLQLENFQVLCSFAGININVLVLLKNLIDQLLALIVRKVTCWAENE